MNRLKIKSMILMLVGLYIIISGLFKHSLRRIIMGIALLVLGILCFKWALEF